MHKSRFRTQEKQLLGFSQTFLLWNEKILSVSAFQIRVPDVLKSDYLYAFNPIARMDEVSYAHF